MKMRHIAALFAAFALSIGATSCKKGDQQAAGGPAEKQAVKRVATTAAVVEGRSIDRVVSVTGTIFPAEEVIVSNEGPGTVASIKADLGDSVEIGDTLAELDQREAKLNLADAQASYVTSVKTLEKEKARFIDAKNNLKRYNDLFKNKMVSDREHDAVKTQYTVADAQYKEADARVTQAEARLNLFKKRFADTVIKAPISGEIKKRYMSIGESVRDRAPMFVIVNTKTLKFKGTISESSAPDVMPGQKVHINVEAYKDKEFEGTVTRVSPAVETDTRTMEIEAHVPNKEKILKPGFFSKGVIDTHRDTGVPFVPDSAVYSFVGITKVFTLANNKAHEVHVKTGQRDGGFIEIIGDIKPGDVVATSNLLNLYEGAQVDIQGGQPQPAKAAMPSAAKAEQKPQAAPATQAAQKSMATPAVASPAQAKQTEQGKDVKAAETNARANAAVPPKPHDKRTAKKTVNK